MSEETPEIEPTEEKPKRRRRKKASAEATSVPEATRESSETESQPEGTRPEAEAEAASASEQAEPHDEQPSPEVPPQAEEKREPEAAEPDAAEPEAAAAESRTEEPASQAEPRARPRRRQARTPAPTPAPRRGRRRRELPDVVVRARAKYVRSSARKARLVCDHIRGRSVEDARAILAQTPRAVARDWSKLLESAVANAEHNHELVGEDLYIKAIHADEGPTIKRYRPRALGRATRIRKRTSHLTILLTPKRQ
ncbi:MAG: 50S ribosomal protein L22 [Solirubrobacterales bacterium]|nr:50S ribosomal protein L22 [Solirubrobacterales bacterium]MBV9166900.1 50S ribosomal protein L22 [Solirubrobacterales bacterium]MBV9535095.1 50S ribosomal protein L22 [Solirubrobacterales bacterium]